MKPSRTTIVVLAGLALVGGLGVYLNAPETSLSLGLSQTQPDRAEGALEQEPKQVLKPQPSVLWQPLSSESDKYQASDVMATLKEDEQAIITLPSGSQYSLRLDRRSSGEGVEQLLATVDPEGLPGFALLTLGEERMYGTLNTPEGVYELVGTQTNFTLRRALEIDGIRRQGPDYKIRERSPEQPATAEKKQMPTVLGAKP